MKKFVILIVCFLITSLAVAQEKSRDLIILGEKVYKCREKTNPKPKDFADIEKCFLKIVNKNKSEAPLACMYMGELYRTMSNKSLNDGQKSLSYYRQAIRLGQEVSNTSVVSKSIYCIGLLYKNNVKGIAQNFDSVYYYYSEAAAYDSIYLVGLGTLYQFGFGVEQDISRAINCYLTAIDNGSTCYTDLYSADYMFKQYNQGTLFSQAYDDYITYFTNYHMNGDTQVALEALQRSADSGFCPAILDLAILYTEGKFSSDCDVMKERAHYYMEQPAMKDYPPALYMNGYVYECTIRMGNVHRCSKLYLKPVDLFTLRSSVNEENFKKVFQYYKASADLGYAPGQLATGICYLNAYGTPQDLDMAEQMIRMSAKQNYSVAVQKQQTYLSQIDYARQNGSEQNVTQSDKILNAINIICGVTNIVAQTFSNVAMRQQSSSRHYTTPTSVVSGKPTSTDANTSRKSASDHSENSRYCKYERVAVCHWVIGNEIKVCKIYIYKQNTTGKLYASFAEPDEYIPKSACCPVNTDYDKETGYNHHKYFSQFGTRYWFD